MKQTEILKGTKWALVTGANSGIGRCYAEQLAALGYNLVVVGIDPEKIQLTRSEIVLRFGIEVFAVGIDLARISAAQELYDHVVAQGIAVEVLINNAGMFSFRDLLTTPVERIERIILLHDLTTTLLCRLFARDMAARGGGYILNMSSFSLWMPFPGLALYSASKAYLRSFSVAFAKEVQTDGIRVTAVCPAGVATDLYGLTPKWQHIGRKVGVLISPDSCARRGLQALWRGRRCIVPDWWNRIFIPLCQLLPMCVLRPIRKYTMKFQK
ncbi:MAG: SDR family NAD(P)-dependent oxidoreductase [Alistipes sp.]